DRGCTTVQLALDATGTQAAPSEDLSPGVHFWRLHSTGGTTPAWEFVVGRRSASVDSSWGSTLDLDADGYGDVLVGAISANHDAGRAYVLRGSAGGLQTTPLPIDA